MQSPRSLHVQRHGTGHHRYVSYLLRTLLASLSALAMLGLLTACGGGTSTDAEQTTAGAETIPESATYVADATAADGKKMTIGIAVDGDDVAAYACNGTDDEAWFFGTRHDGAIDITGRFRDTLQARFDGGRLSGDLMMNGMAYRFEALPVTGDAGIYTADHDGVRATWVVREDGSAVGVQFSPATGQKLEQSDLQRLADEEFRAQVRNKRRLTAAAQINFLADRSARSTINGAPVTPTPVAGTFRLT